MRYIHGSYLFEPGEVGIASHTRVMTDSPRGKPSIFRETMNMEGELRADGQAAIRTRINLLKTGFASEPSLSGLLHSDASLSSHYLLSTGSIGGIKVPTRPSFLGYDGGEYATHRSFKFQVYAEYFTGIDDLYDFQESLSFRGNCGPRHAFIELDTGVADVQQVSEKTIQTIIQRGVAVGLQGYPSVPSPKFTDSATLKLINADSAIDYGGPMRTGNSQLKFTVRWNYIFRSTVAVNGLPTGA